MNAYLDTVKAQRIAADPARSAFVLANAGSGKTRVLTNRVARLLLADTDPAKILCITFTKAAAAEMAERLFKVLGEWALYDDVKLRSALTEIEGDDALTRDAKGLANVRRLFARALETPGGLKIQTIHSFCESVLRRFPLEARVAPGFTVIEESAAKDLRDAALDDLAVAANGDATLADAFTRLSALRNEWDLRALLSGAAAGSQKFEASLARHDGLNGVITATAKELGVDPQHTETDIKKAVLAELSVHDFERAYEALAASGANPEKLALNIQTYLNTSSPTEQWQALSALFMTLSGTPRKKITTKATDKIDSWVKPFLAEQQEIFADTTGQLYALSVFHDTAAYLTVASTLLEKYKAAKAARAALDFDDLVRRASVLFGRTDMAWIMYKLDQGIDHILIDEAQDTSPSQWAVIEAPLKEFFSGAGARDAGRTFFAVGDMKQSIYSFQGADAGLFAEKEADISKHIAAVADYANVPLTLSFRTTAPVLQFVDALFKDPAAAEGLGNFPVPPHGVHREGEAGLVEIWPLTPRPKTPEINPWDAPVDQPVSGHPARVLSAEIAKTIQGWRKEQALLTSQNRPIQPNDIMILVQSRGLLFDEVIRRLAHEGVPVAGADRLKLLEDPAVEDLLSYAKFAVTTADDLSLAEILKSPLFGFDDDNDLFPLAHPRDQGQTLWAALNQRKSERISWEAAANEIAIARTVGMREGPYAFLSHILETGSPSGRRRFYRRLTLSSRDAIDEMLRQALEFENAHPRSLLAFIAWFEENAGDIKREMERENDAVRVMTVHGAKGLEANIVFLIDAHRPPFTNTKNPLIEVPRSEAAPDRSEGLVVMADANAKNLAVIADAREEKKLKTYEEYRRQLYVAATRARERLYICGIELGNAKDPRGKETNVKSWHSLAQDAFDHLGGDVETASDPLWKDDSECIRCYSKPQTAKIKQPENQPTVAEPDSPAWLLTPAATEKSPLRLAPSALAGEEDDLSLTPAIEAPYSPAASHDRYFRGRTLHRLLELLPPLAPAERSAAADRLLGRLAPEIDAAERDRWRDEVLATLGDPQFTRVFDPGSRAEVSIAGAPKGAKDGLYISGQIDRLAIADGKILVVDYKTNRPPPADVKHVSPAYVAQMAAYRALLQEIYPDHEIDTALLWTYDARLMALPSAMLDHAFARYLAAA